MLGFHGVGSFVISGGVNFGIACGESLLPLPVPFCFPFSLPFTSLDPFLFFLFCFISSLSPCFAFLDPYRHFAAFVSDGVV